MTQGISCRGEDERPTSNIERPTSNEKNDTDQLRGYVERFPVDIAAASHEQPNNELPATRDQTNEK
ncbi:MAG: hypothetical protein CVU57_04955 [Deltaproteobacteria bacterium HGW-Deltaproteobacteria-15]|jgi:hypothetical protein|nr:MAG: hypothetical protein CVU57_04955 [Deltaproteobacteria bacterium HGW-Deltaproteobacteria-15]